MKLEDFEKYGMHNREPLQQSLDLVPDIAEAGVRVFRIVAVTNPATGIVQRGYYRAPDLHLGAVGD